jgi:hypothetical protein
MKISKTIYCNSCSTKYKLLTNTLDPTLYCPFCGEEISQTEILAEDDFSDELDEELD